MAEDLHAGEERAEMPGDDRLERDEGAAFEAQEARNDLLRHLHAREGLAAGDGVAEPDRERQGEVRDVGEWPAGAHGERSQDREDLLGEDPVDLLQLGR